MKIACSARARTRLAEIHIAQDSKPRALATSAQFRKRMVRPERFELPASWFVARRSIQLSYGRKVKRAGFQLR